MSKGSLSTTSYVVLGVVAMRGPSTSYELKSSVGRSVGYFWPFPHAQLYSEPKRLVDAGFLTVDTEKGGRHRLTYTITDRGLEALRAWLAEPTQEQMQVRDVAELKLFFGEFATPDDITNLAHEQVHQHRQRIATYLDIQARFGGRVDIRSRMVPLELGLRMEHAALQFWEELEKERRVSISEAR